MYFPEGLENTSLQQTCLNISLFLLYSKHSLFFKQQIFLLIKVLNHYIFFIIQFPVAFIGIVLTLFISGVISTRVYFLRRTLNETDSADHFNENANAKSKRCTRFFPFVNYWARSVLDLTSMYVSAILSCRYLRDHFMLS